MQTLVIDHPLVAHKLTALRDIRTESPTFRLLSDELVTLLAYEATRQIRVQQVQVHTPIGPADGVKLARPVPLVVPVLRAGIGMLDGMARLLPKRSSFSGSSAMSPPGAKFWSKYWGGALNPLDDA